MIYSPFGSNRRLEIQVTESEVTIDSIIPYMSSVANW